VNHPVEKWRYYQTTSECLVVNPGSEQSHCNENCQLWLQTEQTPVTFFLCLKLWRTPWCPVKNVCGLSKGVPQVRHAWQPHWHKHNRSVNLLGFAQWTPFHLKTRFEPAWHWSIVFTSVWKQQVVWVCWTKAGLHNNEMHSTANHVSQCAELIDVIFLFHMKFLMATYLSLVDLLVCKWVHQQWHCCLTYEQTEVDRYPFLSELPVLSILLIKSFKVLGFDCLKGNSFIVLSAPVSFFISQCTNYCSIVTCWRTRFISTFTSAMMSHWILIPAEYLNAHFFSVFYMSMRYKC